MLQEIKSTSSSVKKNKFVEVQYIQFMCMSVSNQAVLFTFSHLIDI